MTTREIRKFIKTEINKQDENNLLWRRMLARYTKLKGKGKRLANEGITRFLTNWAVVMTPTDAMETDQIREIIEDAHQGWQIWKMSNSQYREVCLIEERQRQERKQKRALSLKLAA